jgi:hypothetical protein
LLVARLLLLSQPNGYYELDLRFNDCRLVARMLVQLSVMEPGHSWHGASYDGEPFEATEAWLKEAPFEGVLKLTYWCERGGESQMFRRSLAEDVLGWEFED